MAKVPNIAFYTTCTWAFLCNPEMLVTVDCVAQAFVEY
jgi:hypothetical protein